jgi:hypothetical protein
MAACWSRAAFLEEALEGLLRAPMSHDGGAAEPIEQLFRPDGALGSFSAKIALSRALQLSTIRNSPT